MWREWRHSGKVELLVTVPVGWEHKIHVSRWLPTENHPNIQISISLIKLYSNARYTLIGCLIVLQTIHEYSMHAVRIRTEIFSFSFNVIWHGSLVLLELPKWNSFIWMRKYTIFFFYVYSSHFRFSTPTKQSSNRRRKWREENNGFFSLDGRETGENRERISTEYICYFLFILFRGGWRKYIQT